MARWDDILTLPVQNPPSSDFSSADLVWSTVEGWKQEIDRVVRIPFSRVEDFVRGESSNPECPTRFHVEARRKRPKDAAYKPRVDAYLEYILYWCSFGPDDYRKDGVSRPSRSFMKHKKKTVGRPNTKRGCVCHFIVKKLVDDPSVALIIYNKRKHVDVKGLPCHGPLDVKSAGTRAMYAPDFSDELRLRVMSLLHVGVPVESIMQRHLEMVEKQGGPCSRDDLLGHRYVRTQERNIRRSTYILDPDDIASLQLWVESHQNNVFFYEDFSDTGPLVLGIQSEWQLQQMIQFGNRSLVVYSSQFGMSKLKYDVHSLLVFDQQRILIPVAWIITTRFISSDSDNWVKALHHRIHAKDRSWKLAGFIADDPRIDFPTIKKVFQCSILISFWRVRHEWHTNIIERCHETRMQAEVFKRLGQLVYSLYRKHSVDYSFKEFLEDFVDSTDFVEYFAATWLPAIGIWVEAMSRFPISSQETAAALEHYHYKLKLRLLNEKEQDVYQRADWLADKLATKVHSYFWLDEYTGRSDYIRYKKVEWVCGPTSWREALLIPDTDVILEGECARIINKDDPQTKYLVLNPGSEYALCDCDWSRMGNICKHVIKIASVFRRNGMGTSSISHSCYNQVLNNALHCPPQDSLILDHAVSMAVNIQAQLNLMNDASDNNQQNDLQEKVLDLGGNNSQTGGVISREEGTDDVIEKDAIGNLTTSGNQVLSENINEVLDTGRAEMAGTITPDENHSCAVGEMSRPMSIDSAGIDPQSTFS